MQRSAIKKAVNLSRGFTLVELSIVIVIVALLIGGVLKGQEMVRNANVASTIAQLRSYQGAHRLFFDAYKTMAGDISDATSRVPNCNGTYSCANGNDDGRIGTAVSQFWQWADQSAGTENFQYWKHLALAGFVKDINPRASGVAWGESHPKTPLDFGINAGANDGGGSNPLFAGNYYAMRKEAGNSSSCGFCTISPMHAAQMDLKMDDGKAIEGSFQAISNSWDQGCGVPSAGLNGAKGYDEKNINKTCDVFYKLD